ncbi:hypothetical protein HBN83_02225 [Pseudomonas fragi]|uniref:hypothetical protein n=1 Tax=Pseudomonas fragi TaxID=296 RepID=UPI001473C5ED|nr:hypothetical protein [Pseudomonas fragi]NNB04714.1 hypothetical protein [Pseudomonas fragi]
MSFEIDHYAEWVAALDKHEAELKSGTAPRWEDIRAGQDLRMALGTYKLKCFAARICQNKAAIWARLDKLDALRLHLINKHHWTLAEAREVEKEEDFVFLLHEELLQMKLTEAEAYPVRQWTEQKGYRGEFEQHFENSAP